jgi:hypothetical protein
MALDTVNIKALCPALQNTVVDIVLCRGIRKGEAQWQGRELLILVMVFNKLLQAVGNILPELLGGASLELFWNSVLRLRDIKLSALLGQFDFANTQVGAAHVKGQVPSLLVAVGEAEHPGHVHGLEVKSLDYRTCKVHNNALATYNVASLDGQTWQLDSISVIHVKNADSQNM